MTNVSVRVCAICALVCVLHQDANASATLISDEFQVSYVVSVRDSAAALTDSATQGIINTQDQFVGSVVSGVFSTDANSAISSGLASLTSSFPSGGRIGPGFQFDSFQATGRSIGEASGQLSGDSASGFAETFASVDFSISAPHSYSVTGLLTENSQFSGASISVTSEAIVELIGLDRGNAPIDGASGDVPVDLDGVLDPGSYRLIVVATSEADVLDEGSADSSTSFQNIVLDLTEVPEPATGMFMLAGALMFLRRGQRGRGVVSMS